MRFAAQLLDEGRCDLAAQACRTLGVVKLKVNGTSMLPSVHPGDVVTVRRCDPKDVAVGDVVLFHRYRRLFVHRVVRMAGSAVLTQGDGVPQPDPPMQPGELLGKVVHVDRRGRAVPRALRTSWHHRLAQAMFRRSAIAARLFCRWQAAGAPS